VIIFVDSKKAFDKIQLPFTIKSSEEIRNRRNVSQHTKANIAFNEDFL
jgi:hypothetical protein